MSLDYTIIGGYLEIDKNVFAKEMLSSNRRLRKLLNADDLSKNLKIEKNETGQIYKIDYTHSPEVKLEDDYQEIFQSLNKDYPGKINGKVTIRVNTDFNTFFTEYSIG